MDLDVANKNTGYPVFYLATLGLVNNFGSSYWHLSLKANRSEEPSSGTWNCIDKEPTSLVYKAFAYPGNFKTALKPPHLRGQGAHCESPQR